MPNVAVPANAGGMPKFHLTSIMSEAWAIYRRETSGCRPTFAKDRKKLFPRCLRTAWTWAKHQIGESLKTVQQRAAERVDELTMELMRIDARPWKMSTTTDRRAMQAEIDAIKLTAIQ